ncbi:uncharacterized membrane protein YcaP (DUF421 family) [Bradyrhizobium sp. USDA 4449]
MSDRSPSRAGRLSCARQRHDAHYVALVVLRRIAGPRTLAKWYAFDLIVRVALGSIFANSVLSGDE